MRSIPRDIVFPPFVTSQPFAQAFSLSERAAMMVNDANREGFYGRLKLDKWKIKFFACASVCAALAKASEISTLLRPRVTGHKAFSDL